MKKDFDLLSLGEILLRLSPPNNERIVRGETFMKQVGGAELNVVSGASLLGLRTGIISKLPSHALGPMRKTGCVSAESAMITWSMMRNPMPGLESIIMKTALIPESPVWFMTGAMHPFVKSGQKICPKRCMQTPDASIPAGSPLPCQRRRERPLWR